MSQQSEHLKFFSIFSGTLYTIPPEHEKHMDCGQVPLLDFPKEKCTSCHGRGYSGTDKASGHYVLCKCMGKLIAKERVKFKEVYDIPLNAKYDQE